jgi:hypothetical protein
VSEEEKPQMYRTPHEITLSVLALCNEVNPATQPIFLTINSDISCEPNDCFMCVRRKIEKERGRMQTGWAIWEWPNAFLRVEHHAVYEPSSGQCWIDITPSELLTVSRRLFLPDDRASYSFENEGFRRNDYFKGMVSDPLVYDISDWRRNGMKS